ncbi:MAG: MaoC family dehydratase N-terminal domain-containing protein [Actinomycetota bacterium]|nr:MaoC family dehydratase N-terminal domain-containing protein [Actinomycetota bacterium]
MTDQPASSDGEGGRFAVITDDALDSLRRLIGVPIVDTVEPWCHEATRDNIRHYAHGIGDDNPLWCDPEYAAKGPHSCIVAPPSFVFAMNRVLSGYVGGLPGIHAMWAGADIRWHLPIKRNTEVRTVAHLADLVEHHTSFAGRAIQQIYHVDYYDAATDELLCDGESWCFRTERDTARELGTKYEAAKARPATSYSAQDIQEIFDLYESETRQGAEMLTADQIAVGDELPVMVKGPMTVTGFIAFAQGWGGLYIRANRLAWQQLRKHPGLGINNAFGVPDVPERVHWETDLATEVGTPAAYDYGPERCSWLTHHLTDWMGDHAQLVSHSNRIRHHNVVGDWIKITGHITSIDTDDTGATLVEVTQEAHNQHGDLSATGLGVARLASG